MNPEQTLFQSTNTPRRFLARFVRAGALARPRRGKIRDGDQCAGAAIRSR